MSNITHRMVKCHSEKYREPKTCNAPITIDLPIRTWTDIPFFFIVLEFPFSWYLSCLKNHFSFQWINFSWTHEHVCEYLVLFTNTNEPIYLSSGFDSTYPKKCWKMCIFKVLTLFYGFFLYETRNVTKTLLSKLILFYDC